MITRQILVVKTLGSRKTKDLRPDMVLERGLNMTVLEYLVDDSEAVMEIWGSDHPVFAKEEQISGANDPKMTKMRNQKSVVKALTTHPKSPQKIGNISLPYERVTIDTTTVPPLIKFKGSLIKYMSLDDTKHIVILDEG